MKMNKLSSDRKKQIAGIGKGLLIIIMVLTFFSKTIANIMLPSVKVCIPIKSDLSKKITCEGEILFKEITSILSPIPTKVLEMYVKEGDSIKKGQSICLLDTTDVKREIELKEIELEKSRLTREGLAQKLVTIGKKINKEKNTLKEKELDSQEPDDQYSLAIENKKRIVEVNEALYKEGLISENELIGAKIELADLEKERQSVVDTIENKIEELEEDRDNVQREIALTALELKEIQLNLDQLIEGMVSVIVASQSGIVMGNGVGEGTIVQDEGVSKGQVLIKIGVIKEGFQIKVTTDQNIDFIKVGDDVDLKIGDKGGIKGVIENIVGKKSVQDIYIGVKESEIEVSELAKVTFKDEGLSYDNVIPSEALYKTDGGYYVYTVEIVDDALGNAYSVKKTNVYVEDYNDTLVAIEQGVNALDWVIIASQKSIKEGVRVKIENENEVLGND